MSFHIIEVVFILGIMATSSSNQSVTDSVYLLVSLVLAYKLSLVSQDFNKLLSFKRMLLLFMLVMAFLIVITKVALIESKMVDLSALNSGSDAAHWELYGIRFTQQGETFKINWMLTLLADAIVIILGSLYLFYIRQVR